MCTVPGGFTKNGRDAERLDRRTKLQRRPAGHERAFDCHAAGIYLWAWSGSPSTDRLGDETFPRCCGRPYSSPSLFGWRLLQSVAGKIMSPYELAGRPTL